MPSTLASSSPGWFKDENILLGVARAERKAAAPPSIPGYDDLNELKRGGQGVVYSALQRSTLRRVAIKVLLAGSLASLAQRRRFEREAEVAAGLRHANIVRIFDSGVTSDGFPYLVMEYVEGVALQEYITARPLRQRVELFLKIADAVAYAHQRGIIHRDLKPSNIRVDTAGEPRVLDFGLAKPVSDIGDTLGVSQTGQFLGSLPWASPEQIEGVGHGVDVRGDVYSLGVMLYEIICGRMPYDVTGGITSAMANIRLTSPAPIPAESGADADLATIACKCLAKEPERRYQSAGELSSDLRAWLAGDPISARRDSAWYTLRKSASRYRRVAWAAGLVTLAMSALLAWSIHSRISAVRERDAATRATSRAEASLKFLSDLLASASPGTVGGGRDVRVVDLLDPAGATIDQRFLNDPETRAQLHEMIANIYSRLDLLDRAGEHYEKAMLALVSSENITEHDERVLRMAGNIATLALHRDENEKGAAQLEELERRYAAAGITRGENLSTTLSALGVAYRRMDRVEDALAAYTRASAALPDGQHESDAALSLAANIAVALETLGRLDEAGVAYSKLIETRERISGPDHIETISAKLNYAHYHIIRGEPEKGRDLLRAAVAGAERGCGPGHLTTLFAMNNLAKCEEDMRNDDAAISLYRDIVARYAVHRPSDNINVLIPMANLGGLLFHRKGEQDEGIRLCKEALDRTLASRGEKSYDALIRMNNYGAMLGKMQRHEEAEALLRRVVELSSPQGGVLQEGAWQHSLFKITLGNCLVAAGKFEEAEKLLLDAHAHSTRVFGQAHPQSRRAASGLADLYRAINNPDQAARWDSLSSPQPSQPAKGG